MAGAQAFPVQWQNDNINQYQYQSNPLMEAAAYQQLYGYPSFAGAMQGAMGQMWNVNQANQQAKLFNNSLNSQLGQTNTMANALMQQALANAYGNIGSAWQQRQGMLDQLNNPTMKNYLEGNSGVAVANAQNAGALARLQQLPGLLSSLGGLFGLGGTGGGGGGGLLGFVGSGGQSATLGPQAPQSPTTMAVKASQPLPQQASQMAVGQPTVNRSLASLTQPTRGNQQNMDYLSRYMGVG